MSGGRIDLLRWPRAALRGAALVLACALAAAIALAFLCAALFIIALNRYGAVNTCLGAAVAFLVVAIILGTVQAALAERRRREARDAAAAVSLAALANPRMILLGLQIAQTIGLKRLAPILVAGAAAFALAGARSDGGAQREARRRRRAAATARND